MLELRPSCEHCNRALPPHATDARICSFECTFCAACVASVLHDVCPNCGGGFAPRPVRPRREWKPGECLDAHPASAQVRHRPVDVDEHERFARILRDIPPDAR
jgi:hypothetical protein